MYYFALEFLSAVEIPSYQETRITRGATLLWHLAEAKYLVNADLLLDVGEVHTFEE